MQCVFAYLGTVAFALIINVPRRALNLGGWAGATGWMVYWVLFKVGCSIVLANLLGAFAIGIAAIVFARWRKIPVIVFTIPGLVPLVPGGTAYEAVRMFVEGQTDAGIGYLVRVIMVAGAIAVGFMLAQLFGDLTKRRIRLR
ncbi:hypothetical protein FD19_GL001848 [Lacticaseibacillus thailandensis DSM 22698 = JCM 13996]|uniref:Threonine/Serine exporter ThrE domain-containing protein n=1 Tax=Lacticaseibacillus thailandensis DSM 22698 = JCM 13996 TaxID=1423810 RepID=A0A0R2C4V4_9LACO|nr:hypothetical protein FD19_GL001848 [Lacticaseibacillus thailandensis DSM 22698 = JCM 13996]